MDFEKFAKFFNNAPVVQVSGRSYPVEVFYDPPLKETEYVKRAVERVFKIHFNDGPGDILVFLSGKEEIEITKEMIENSASSKGISNIVVLACYGSMTLDEQQLIFKKTMEGERKVKTNTLFKF